MRNMGYISHSHTELANQIAGGKSSNERCMEQTKHQVSGNLEDLELVIRIPLCKTAHPATRLWYHIDPLTLDLFCLILSLLG